ncbi:hypothetical protein G3435_18620 [Pseudomonas sp. MAFF212428]|uniref:Coenzyme PQQ synthesis protein F-like C-terminal lobe domain-containing protein n=1 Tax=Pseudomonas brassicae TaxID=2708063 RepID=A0A6M0D582_9PSED|nr:hypothetical protein [Pseudomonas brassicae]
MSTCRREHALLVFCPAPEGAEAVYRLLAHRLQGPFYQRLRVELQLGYAVFSALRQVHGVTGILLGVQSPSASPASILGHMRSLLCDFSHAQADDADARQALAAQFHETDMSNADVAEWGLADVLVRCAKPQPEHLAGRDTGGRTPRTRTRRHARAGQRAVPGQHAARQPIVTCGAITFHARLTIRSNIFSKMALPGPL